MSSRGSASCYSSWRGAAPRLVTAMDLLGALSITSRIAVDWRHEQPIGQRYEMGEHRATLAREAASTQGRTCPHSRSDGAHRDPLGRDEEHPEAICSRRRAWSAERAGECA